MLTEPWTAGLQEHVAVPPFELLTTRDLHPEITLPEARKVTFPDALTVAEIDVAFR
jgi:hypothetical protein